MKFYVDQSGITGQDAANAYVDRTEGDARDEVEAQLGDKPDSADKIIKILKSIF
jgi:hypothetical protein